MKRSEWISISDMMSGLMLIFMFISIIYMIEFEKDRKRISEIAITYNRLKKELYFDLKNEFEKDLKKWNAEILDDNTIRFKEPNVLFEVGKSDIKEKFKVILDDFFPRYSRVLLSKTYKDNIEEISIEGHTSSDWKGSDEKIEKYLKNVELSQQRSLEVLKYCISLNKDSNDRLDWLIDLFRGKGVSFAKPILHDINGTENKELSRRVEFKVITKSEKRIEQILEATK